MSIGFDVIETYGQCCRTRHATPFIVTRKHGLVSAR